MPMRHLTVTGIATSAFMAATPSPTSAGSAIRQAPKRPSCTRSDGQPTLRLISSNPASAQMRAQAAAGREPRRVRPAELDRQRMLLGVVAQEARPVAMQYRRGGDHLGVEQ